MRPNESKVFALAGGQGLAHRFIVIFLLSVISPANKVAQHCWILECKIRKLQEFNNNVILELLYITLVKNKQNDISKKTYLYWLF